MRETKKRRYALWRLGDARDKDETRYQKEFARKNETMRLPERDDTRRQR